MGVLLALSSLVPTGAYASVDAAEAANAGDVEFAKPTAPWDVVGTSGPASVIAGDSRMSRVTLVAGDRAACTKRIDFSPDSHAILCTFNLALTVDPSRPPVVQSFRIGSDFTASTDEESDARTFAQLGIVATGSTTGFQLRDPVGNRSSSTFEGTQAITWVLNPSRAAVTYSAPDGTTESIASARMDVWVGRNKVFDDASVTNPNGSASSLKWLWSAGSGVTTFGQLAARSLEPAATAATIAAPSLATAMPATPAEADGVELYQPWPNPSSAAVRYAYEIRGGAERVDVGVYDIAGRVIRRLVHGTQSPGRYEVVWDGLNDVGARVRGAVYFLRASVGTSVRVSRIALVK